MKLIAEAGGTKIAWVLLDGDQRIDFKTVGYNPLQNDSNYLRQIMISGFPAAYNPAMVNSIAYFGTGCATAEGKNRVERALKNFFSKVSEVLIFSDLEAVGLACFKSEKGIVGILGTGASVAFYNGISIEMPVPSLGYLLGDEGSGAYLGKLLLAKVLRKEFDDDILTDFYQQFNISAEQIVPQVYAHKKPAQLLASYAIFLTQHIQNKQIESLVHQAIDLYIAKHVEPLLKLYPNYPLAFVGSVAFGLGSFLTNKLSALTKNKIMVCKSPLEGLL